VSATSALLARKWARRGESPPDYLEVASSGVTRS
jgi:hypothetical protein